MYRHIDTAALELTPMAIYHLNMKVLSRSRSESAVASAAYRHSAKMENEFLGSKHDFERKRGTIHSEFALPEDAPKWVIELANAGPIKASEQFWNRVESFETRGAAQYAREMTLALPVELSIPQNIEMVREFVKSNFTDRGIVADWAYHNAKGNPHVHIMTALRPLTEEGFGQKNIPLLDANGEQQRSESGSRLYQQFAGDKELVPALRLSWEQVQNQHLAEHGFDIRVSHKSYKEQGIDLEPSVHRGPAADGLNRKNQASERIELAEEIDAVRRAQVMNDPSIILQLISREKSVFDERDIARMVNKFTDNREDFQALLLRAGAAENLLTLAAPVFNPMTGEIVERAKFSTKDVLETEITMISGARNLALVKEFGVKERPTAKAIERVETKENIVFDPAQREVIQRLAGDQAVSVMVGYAGAGKSTVMQAVREIYESQGHRVVGGALAGKAAVGLAESSGIESRTLASWEANWKNDLRQLGRGDVFVMDEAGMVSSGQMQRFVTQVEQAGAKLILLGDARQLQPIEAGAAFRAIADDVGYIELTGVRRQRTEWMQQATIQFGSGAASEAIEQYIANDLVHLESDTESAQTWLIQNWFTDWQAGGDTIILAHRNKDVLALNDLARDAIKATGGLQDEHSFKTNRGAKLFAEGDRILFLEKDRNLGVENGTFANVTKAEHGRLEVALDNGETIRISQNTYSNLDYGYAATIHKCQGATVDNAHVYASTTMDAHMTYVAMSRHRDSVNLYGSEGDFKNLNVLTSELSRERMKITTLAYEHTVDFAQSVKEFAERRGINSPNDFADIFQRQINGLRARFNSVVERFEAFSQRIENIFRLEVGTEQKIEQPVSQVVQVDSPRAAPVEVSQTSQPASLPDVPAKDRAIVLPDMIDQVRQALARLSHSFDHSQASGTDRSRRKWSTNVQYELHDGSAAADLTRFNAAINNVIPAATILAIGPRTEGAEWDKLEASLSDESVEQLSEIWPLIHAGQNARHHNMNLEIASVIATDRKEELVAEQYEKRQAMFRSPETPMIGSVTNWAKDIAETVMSRVLDDPRLHDTSGKLLQAISHVWKDPEAVLANLTNRIAHHGISSGQFSPEIRNNPENFGELVGHRNFFGRNDSARTQALDAVPYAIAALQVFNDQHNALSNSFTKAETRFRTLMQEPLEDLSPAASRLLERLENTPRDDLAQSLNSSDDNRAFAELKGFAKEVQERFGVNGSNELDHERLRSAIPNASTERVAELEGSFGRVRTVTYNMAFAERMETLSHTQEQRLSQSQDNSLSL